ncbi:SPOR domain-containing protein [Paracoccus sp. WLY502]|uniref:SPOR domain-containing protein n=1 Tax=Paracoccus yibinensis TaxID=3068891 RepID=UPI002796C5DD|nr:SPOR domain-containing protein [Paracoccus sp. WLY502]MDQ1902318.1 SPOR domain-containing protein [Paracoccus sp. WLY502]
MRILAWMVLVLWLPGRVLAAPEPPPPGDYPGAQYIDRTGCVFVRDGEEWSPRLDKQGAPICGFPPSQPAEAASAPETLPSPEEVLTAVLAEGLRSGDLAAGEPLTPLVEAAPDPAQAELDKTLALQVELDARLRSAMAGRAPDGLCARLGYRPAGDETPIIGGDVTQGLCPGMKADPAPAVVAERSAEPKAAATPPSENRPAESTRKAEEPRSVKRVEPDPAKVGPKPASVVARRPEPPRTATPLVEMIPANARYVWIGTYSDEANALAALRRLSGLGYRTAQRSERVNDEVRKEILAGPFADRQALVSALARLRANGYPRAVAR